MKIVQATYSNGRVAYFCPECGELVNVDAKEVPSTARSMKYRVFLDSCDNAPDSTPPTHIVYWIEE